MSKRTCPHCGNQNRKLMQDNGERYSSPDLTLLCVAPVRPDEWSFATKPEPEDFNPDNTVPCGMQWEPNQ